MKKCTHNI